MNLKKRQQLARQNRKSGRWTAPWITPRRSRREKTLDAIIEALKNKHDVYFMWPMRPLHAVGPIGFTCSSDKSEMQKCRIDESRYKVQENFKIMLRAEDPAYSYESFYLMDLFTLLRDGVGQLWIEGTQFSV